MSGLVRSASDAIRPEEIYALPMDGRWLLFSPRTWTCALVNGSAVDAIARCADGGADGESESVRKLWEQLALDPVEFVDTNGLTEKLVIIPTRACNMDCVYCDFAAADASRAILDPRLACRLFDHFAETKRDAVPETMRVHFFGGEPMVARNCVETIVHYVRAFCAERNAVPWFEITTNGIFEPTAVPFLGDYVDSLVVSLDGHEDLHDGIRRRRNGSGTYAAIAANLRSLRDYPVELSLRTCVTDRSVDSMAEIATHLWGEFSPGIFCFEMLAENAATARAGLSAPDPLKFAAGVLRTEMALSEHGVRVVHGPSECTGPRRTSCPLGQGALMLNPDGELTGCYLDPRRWTALGMDLTIGSVDSNSGVEIKTDRIQAIDDLLADKPRCEKCFCRFTCAGGCHVDQTPPGCSEEFDDRCRAIRVTTAIRLVRNLEGWDSAIRVLDRPAAIRAIADLPDDRLSSHTPWTGGGLE